MTASSLNAGGHAVVSSDATACWKAASPVLQLTRQIWNTAGHQSSSILQLAVETLKQPRPSHSSNFAGRQKTSCQREVNEDQAPMRDQANHSHSLSLRIA